MYNTIFSSVNHHFFFFVCVIHDNLFHFSRDNFRLRAIIDVLHSITIIMQPPNGQFATAGALVKYYYRLM